jgi:hypothetical protein
MFISYYHNGYCLQIVRISKLQGLIDMRIQKSKCLDLILIVFGRSKYGINHRYVYKCFFGIG